MITEFAGGLDHDLAGVQRTGVDRAPARAEPFGVLARQQLIALDERGDLGPRHGRGVPALGQQPGRVAGCLPGLVHIDNDAGRQSVTRRGRRDQVLLAAADRRAGRPNPADHPAQGSIPGRGQVLAPDQAGQLIGRQRSSGQRERDQNDVRAPSTERVALNAMAVVADADDPEYVDAHDRFPTPAPRSRT